jgi:hypothetical protein
MKYILHYQISPPSDVDEELLVDSVNKTQKLGEERLVALRLIIANN